MWICPDCGADTYDEQEWMIAQKDADIQLLRSLLREADYELEDMTQLDCPVYVTRCEDLSSRIDRALEETGDDHSSD